jgi:hypothetical protein
MNLVMIVRIIRLMMLSMMPAITVDDSNFYDYFDEDGNLQYNSFKKMQ